MVQQGYQAHSRVSHHLLVMAPKPLAALGGGIRLMGTPGLAAKKASSKVTSCLRLASSTFGRMRS